MTKKALIKMLETFSINYNTKQPEDQMVKLYYESLKDIPDNKANLIIQTIISKERFYPNIAVIREHYANIETPKLSEAEVLTTVNRLVQNFGRYRHDEAMKSIQDENIKATIKAFGFQNICNCDINYKSNQIVRVYKELAENNRDMALLSADCREMITEVKQESLKMLGGIGEY